MVHEGKWLEHPFGECNAIIRLSQPFSPLLSRRVNKYSWRYTWVKHFNSAINVLWVSPLRNILTCLEVAKHWVMLPFWGWGEFQREKFYIGDISLILPPSNIESSQLSFSSLSLLVSTNLLFFPPTCFHIFNHPLNFQPAKQKKNKFSWCWWSIYLFIYFLFFFFF